MSEVAPRAPRISLCVIARDEERNLPGCLSSAAFCDEVVVIDSGSVDRTVDVARRARAVVVKHEWRGYGAQRNVALDHATGDWVLELDADERLTPGLAAEIERFVADPPPGVDLGGLPLRDILVGHRLGPSAKYPKYRHRLVRRGTLRHHEGRTVHEGFVPEGPVHPFAGDLDHLLATTWSEAVADAWRYARMEAEQLAAPRTAGAVLRGAVLRPAAKLVYRLAVDGGWRDGLPGLAKIALDCGSDTLVWVRHGLGLHRRRGDSGVVGPHYGQWPPPAGSPHIAAVALAGRRSVDRAVAWSREALAAGADPVLVAPAEAAGVRTRVVAGRGPVALARALDAEHQLRPLDAVIGFDAGARAVLRVVPGVGRTARVLGDDLSPGQVVERALAARGEKTA